MSTDFCVNWKDLTLYSSIHIIYANFFGLSLCEKYINVVHGAD